MKRTLLLLLCVAVGFAVNAKEITRQQALQKAQQFMQGKQFAAVTNRAQGQNQTQEPQGYYVFNAEAGGGFVIVAGDDRMPEILGYSDHGNLDHIPVNMKSLLDYYHDVALHLDNITEKRIANSNRAAMTDIAPLVTTHWDQRAPYNSQCPIIDGARPLTGCVATAMAQVINYNKWPQEETTSVPAYVTDTRNFFLPELPPTTFDWDNMDSESIARLMLYCGQSVAMDYCNDYGESGANTGLVPKALMKVFGYSTLTKFVDASSYSKDEWENLLYNELTEDRPVLYGGYGSEGGHAFVVDGYQDGRFHVNWGWGGSADGFFLLQLLGPEDNGMFSSGQHAIIGIRPPREDDPSEPPSEPEDKDIYYGQVTLDGVTYDLRSYRENFFATILPNASTGKYAGEVYVPEYVNYDGNQFRVEYLSNVISPFSDCDELTSLSIAMRMNFYISNCPKLAKLELREGVVRFSGIMGCESLKELELPRTLSVCGSLSVLSHLKTIRFMKTGRFSLLGSPFQKNDLPALTDVYFLTATPPTLEDNNTIESLPVNPNVTIHIPQGSLEEYENSIFKGWKFVDDQPGVAPSIVWGYGKDDKVLHKGMLCNRGDNDSEMAILVPASEMALYQGGRIAKIEFFTRDSFNGPEYVFITKPGTDYLMKQSTTTLEDSWTSVDLDEPFVITGEELYVGVGRHHGVSMTFADELAPNDYCLLFRAMGNDTSYDMRPGVWQFSSDVNPLALRFVIESDNFKAGMTVSEIRMVNNISGKSDAADGDYLEATVMNRSINNVNSFTIEWTIDGTKKGSQSYEKEIRSNSAETVVVNLPVLTGKDHTITMHVGTVNGEPNSMGDKSATLEFSISSRGTYPRRIVMEEGTGTWCGWCPRGTATIDRMIQEYPDNFIPIVVHTGDEMSDAVNYQPIIDNRFGSYPVCLLNRQLRADPAYPETKNFVESEMFNAEALIQASAAFLSADSSSVFVQTRTEFAFDDPNGSNYQIAYVVVEDSVGPYNQTNNYSDPYSSHTDSYLDWWIHQDYYVSMLYHHVARGIYGNHNGVSGSIPATIAKGTSYSYTYYFPLPDNIGQKKNIRLIALLMNTKTNEILNAAECNIDGLSSFMIISAKNCSREYGEENPAFEYETVGGELVGVPEFTCEATAASPAGTYPIVMSRGSVTNDEIVFVEGTLTITKAPLTIKAGEYTKKQGEENPEFTLTFEGFKNNETKEVLTRQPLVTCSATKDSAPGTYEVKVSRASASNYDISYVNGVLTVIESTGIANFAVDGNSFDIYNLRGQKVRQDATSLNGLPKGVYIVNGRQVVKK